MKKLKLLVVALILLVVTGCGYDYSKLEAELTDKASTYYEEYIKGFVSGISQHKITLEALKNSGVNIDNFVERECDLQSYALIKLEVNEDGTVADDYEVENFLTCKKYETKKDKK